MYKDSLVECVYNRNVKYLYHVTQTLKENVSTIEY